MIKAYDCDVVVVDSGVDCAHPELNSAVIQGISASVSGMKEGCDDVLGHGTAI